MVRAPADAVKRPPIILRRLTFAVYFALAFIGGCASTFRPATGTGNATARVALLVHVAIDGQRVIRRRMVVVNNPTDDEVLLDCHSFRWRIPAHMAGDALLMPADTACDLQSAEVYVPIPDVPIGVVVRK